MLGKGTTSAEVFDLSVSRISIGVYNFFVMQCMSHRENRNELLRSLISDVGSKDQLIKILVAEIGRDVLLEVFPSISLSDVELSLSNRLHDIVVKDRNGLFIKYNDSGNIKIVYLLKVFIDYVLSVTQQRVDYDANMLSQSISGKQERKCVSQDVGLSESMNCVSSKGMPSTVKKDSSVNKISKILSSDREQYYHSNTLPYRNTSNTQIRLLGKSSMEFRNKAGNTVLQSDLHSGIASCKYHDDRNMPSTSGMSNSKLSVKSATDSGKSTTKLKNVGSFSNQGFVLTKTVKRLSSFSSIGSKSTSLSSVASLGDGQDSVEIVDRSVCEGITQCSDTSLYSVVSGHSVKNTCILKMSNNLFHRRKISKDEDLGKFVKDLVMQLHNPVYSIGRLTDHLSLQGNYMIFNWIMSCIIRSSDFGKCEAIIINDIRPCCAYYKTIISIPHTKISSLYIESLHNLGWVNSQVRLLHTLVHKGKADGISFSMSKDHVRREARKHMSGINEELVGKLRKLFQIFDTTCITQKILAYF